MMQHWYLCTRTFSVIYRRSSSMARMHHTALAGRDRQDSGKEWLAQEPTRSKEASD